MYTTSRSADLRQAQYYQQLLDDMRAVAQRELEDHANSLHRRRQSGKKSSFARLNRLIGAKQAELAALDQLIDALETRFGDVPVIAVG